VITILVIKFSCINQRLRRINLGTIPSNAHGKVKLEFDFRTDDWSAAKTKTANFYYNRVNCLIDLDENNQCFIPAEVFDSPSFKISVCGGDIITNTINIPIDGDRNIDPSAYETIIKLIDEHTHEEYLEDDEVEEILPDIFDAGKITERS
jgi:hypothetical protein